MLRNKITKKILSYLLMAMLLLNLMPVSNAMALNAAGNKANNFQGYRYLNANSIQVWVDKNTPSTNYDTTRFKIFEGTNIINGHQLQLQSATAGSGSNITGVTGLSGAASVILTTMPGDPFIPGQIYTVVMNNTIKANNGLTQGNYYFNKDITCPFTAPEVAATPNANATYASGATGMIQSRPENGTTNVPVEGNIWFSVNIAVYNYDTVKSGLVLKKNGVQLTFDNTINTSQDGEIYAPIVSDDHTFFFFPMTGSGGNTSYNLEPDAQYSLEIPTMQLVNGQTIPAQTITFNTTNEIAPTKITGAPTVAPAGNNFQLTWTASTAVYAGTPATLVSPGATGYNIYASKNPYWDFVKLNTSPVTELSYLTSKLDPATTYYFRVTPVNGGSEGGFSDPGPAMTTPGDTGAPTWTAGSSLAANAGRYDVALDWTLTPAADDYWVSSYRIFADGALIDTVDGDTTSYTAQGLNPGTDYNFKVEAGDKAGNWSTDGPTATATTLPPDVTAPVWPTGSSLKAANITATGLTLNWNAAVDNDSSVMNYKVYQNDNLLATVEGSVYTYNVDGLTTGNQYNFKVEAVDEEANCSTTGPTASVNLSLPVPTTVTVGSPQDKIALDASTPVAQQFSGVIRDQYNSIMDGRQVTWSVYKNPIGVTIDSKGLLTIQPVASPGQVTVTATVYGTGLSGSRQLEINASLVAPVNSTDVTGAIDAAQNTNSVTLPASTSNGVSLDSSSLLALNTAAKTVVLATDDTTFELKIDDLALGGTDLSDVTQFQIGRKTVDSTTNAQLTSGNTLSNLSGGTFQVLGTTFQLDAVAQLSGDQQQIITSFNHPITVRIAAPPVTLGSNQSLVACRFNTDTGKWEEMGTATYSNGFITFTTNHFSNWSTMVKTVSVSGDGGGSGSGGNGSDGANSDDPMAGRKPLNFVGAYLTTISNNTSSTGEAVSGSTTVPVKPTIKLYFDKNIVSDLVWNENKLCFSMQDSVGNNVPIEVSRISDQDNFSERQNVFIAPVNDLTKGKTYEILVSPKLLAKNLNSHLSDTTNGQGVKLTFQVEIPQLDQFKVSNDGKTSSVVIDEEAENWQNVDLYTALGGSVSSGRLVIPKALVAKSATSEIPLRVKFDSAEIRVPMTDLAAYSNQNKDVAIDLERLPQSGNAKGQANETFNSTGNTYSVKFYLLESDGKSCPLSLSIPVEVRMAVDTAKMSQEQIDGLGLYVLDDTTKGWRYLGGVVEDKNFVGKTTVSGTMAVWSYERVFSDLNGHWAAKDINYLAKKHIANGVNPKEFKPNANVTRAEFAVLLARLLDLKPSAQAKFSDVNSSGWYAGMVNAAAEAGLVSGFNGKFRPTDKISREEMALLIVKAYKLKGKTVENKISTTSQFKDGSTVSGWARDSVDQAVQLGIIKGSNDNTFGPIKNATRAEAFVVVKRLLEQVG